MSEKLLTIGMATYDDYDGIYFTIQSLREHHLKNIEKDIEFIVLDNNPTSKHGDSVKKFTQNFVKGKYIPYTEKSSSFNKYKIVDFANGKYVIIVDCHVLFSSNAITSLLKYFEENPNCKDLIQGPLVNDNLIHESTHLNEEWRNDMYGFWACDHEKLKTKKPFEIKMQGMGCCAFEKSNWPKINKNFVGFGGEEWYIAEKFRQNGGKNICLPDFKWIHRFARPNGVPYKSELKERIWNYYLGWYELYRDDNHPLLTSMINYFKEKHPRINYENILKEAKSTFE